MPGPGSPSHLNRLSLPLWQSAQQPSLRESTAPLRPMSVLRNCLGAGKRNNGLPGAALPLLGDVCSFKVPQGRRSSKEGETLHITGVDPRPKGPYLSQDTLSLHRLILHCPVSQLVFWSLHSSQPAPSPPSSPTTPWEMSRVAGRRKLLRV